MADRTETIVCRVTPEVKRRLQKQADRHPESTMSSIMRDSLMLYLEWAERSERESDDEL